MWFCNKLLTTILLSLLLLSEGVGAEWWISRQEWAVPRSAQMFQQLPGVQRVMQEKLLNPRTKLLLAYPGGDTGHFWAVEVRSWFISMGVPAKEIEMMPASGKADMMRLKIMNNDS